jgi:hypothetical protein
LHVIAAVLVIEEADSHQVVVVVVDLRTITSAVEGGALLRRSNAAQEI